MSFLGLIFKNLLRQPVRAGLTLLGISVGITTVVALGIITSGLKSTFSDVLTMAGADFMVAQDGSADLSFSTVPEGDEARVAQLPGVARAVPALMHITQMGGNPFFILMGFRPEDLAFSPPRIVEGALLSAGATDEIMLGDSAAAALGKGVGDTLTFGDRTFRVVGVYHAGALWEDNGAKTSLAAAQDVAAKPGSISVIYVTVAEGASVKSVAASVERTFKHLASITNTGDVGKVDQGVRLLDAANLAISILAVGIGAIGVMNTMIMSVFERTREIGILRAVGWSGARVLRMILAESLMLCVVAAFAGSALGTGASRAVILVPAIGNLLEPVYTVDIFIRALLVATVVAVVGAAYPAYRAVRLTPMQALRYE